MALFNLWEMQELERQARERAEREAREPQKRKGPLYPHVPKSRLRARIKLLERHQLADGGFAQVTKLGYKYTFTRGYPSLTTPPDWHPDLTKAEAMNMLADALRADVLEIEE